MEQQQQQQQNKILAQMHKKYILCRFFTVLLPAADQDILLTVGKNNPFRSCNKQDQLDGVPADSRHTGGSPAKAAHTHIPHSSLINESMIPVKCITKQIKQACLNFTNWSIIWVLFNVRDSVL